MYDPTDQVTIEKRYPNILRLAEFPFGFDLSILNLEIEVYKMEKNYNPGGGYFIGSNAKKNMQTASRGKDTRMVFKTHYNDIRLHNFRATKGTKNSDGIYMIRLRDTVSGFYSDFFDTKISIRNFPVCETNASLSLNNCVGYYQVTRLV